MEFQFEWYWQGIDPQFDRVVPVKLSWMWNEETAKAALARYLKRLTLTEPGYGFELDGQLERLAARYSEYRGWSYAGRFRHVELAANLELPEIVAELAEHELFIMERNGTLRPGFVKKLGAAAAVVEAARFAFSPEGRKPKSGAMGELRAAVAAYNEAQELPHLSTDEKWQIIEAICRRAVELGREKERPCPVDFWWWPEVGVFGCQDEFPIVELPNGGHTVGDEAIEQMAREGLCKGWHSHQ